MKKFSLNIADIIFSVTSNDRGPDLQVSPAYSGFLDNGTTRKPLVNIYVRYGNPLHEGFTKVFTARHPVSGSILWSVLKYSDKFCFIAGDEKNPGRTLCALTSYGFTEWTIFISEDSQYVDPLCFPAGLLLISYSVLFQGGIMLHASAVDYNGKGLIFAGQSGAGKTTIAELFHSAGGTIINDDRIILRKVDKEIKIHNTPMWYEDAPRSVSLCACFKIHHTSVNSVRPVRNIFEFWPSVVQHNFDKDIIMQQISMFSSIFQSIPLQHLGFSLDKTITTFVEHFLQENI